MRFRAILTGAVVTSTLALSPILAPSASALTTSDLHVNPMGSDANPGTAASPLKTIQAALNRAVPGVTVNLAAGTYRERPVTKIAGTASAPITIKGPEAGKDRSGRYRAVLFGTSRVFNIDHSYYVLDGFTVDGQEALQSTAYPTSSAQVRAFKDANQSKVADGRLVYVGSSDTSRNITGVVIRNMYLNGAGGECIRMRNNAFGNVVENSTITWCGLFGKGDDVQRDKYHNGEGIYIGTSPNSTTQPMYSNDTSSGNRVENNTIWTYGSECYNVKENAHHNLFRGNDCRGNQESVTWLGSAIEIRGHANEVVWNTVADSRGYGVKLKSDSTTYDKGANLLRGNDFRLIDGHAVLNDQKVAQAAPCGNVFDSTRVLTGNALPGLTSTCTTYVSPAPSPSPSPTTGPTVSSAPVGTATLTIEAESGVVKAPMSVKRDPSAGGGAAVVQERESGTGTVTYRISVPRTGSYQLGGRVIAPTGSSNSLSYRVDGASSTGWHFQETRTWQWQAGPLLSLTQGDHTLVLVDREEGTTLDAFTLTAR